MNKQPILVTGIDRSGATWIGNTIGYSSKSKCIYESFNIIINYRKANQKLAEAIENNNIDLLGAVLSLNTM
ncbi:hypothetical protein, partial [Formosa algae]|uniref:hypothetical protein n=1 Tax=Formosa algae TaxID=225843 RepID=UPI000AD8D783